MRIEKYKVEKCIDAVWDTLSFIAVLPLYLIARYLGWAYGMCRTGFRQGKHQAEGW